MINVICGKILRIFKDDQRHLLGLSLLFSLMSVVIMILSGVVPLIGISIVLVLAVGMKTIFLSAYQQKKISTNMLFVGFERLKHVCGGMLWAFFKITVWLLIPIVGIPFAISKAYEYRFVPYILLSRPEICATSAVDISREKTDGFKAHMFYIDVAIIGALMFIEFILYLLSLIPIVGIVFAAAMAVGAFCMLLLIPFIRGLVDASFYYEIIHNNIKPAKRFVICPSCLGKTDADGCFCSKCGEPLNGSAQNKVTSLSVE